MARSKTKIWLLAAFLGIGGGPLAQVRLPPCPAAGYKDKCFGETTSFSGSVEGKFVGEFKNGQPSNGRITLIASDGMKHLADMRDGDVDTQSDVTIIWPDGVTTFTGRMKDGMMNGQGRMIYSNGNKYVGEFRDDKLNGHGTMIFSNGNKYVGEYRADKATGQGTLTWSDGSKYVGYFKDDTGAGRGTMTTVDGRIYVGEVTDFKSNGQGVLTWPDGQKYVGEFKNGVVSGRGTHTWPDGQKYVGEFKDNEADGQGRLTWPNGTVYVGQVTHWTPNGHGTAIRPSGEKYVGEFRDGAFDGRGIEYRAGGSILRVGRWRNNIFVEADVIEPTIAVVPPAPPTAQARPQPPEPSSGPIPPGKRTGPSLSSTGTGFFISSRGDLLTNRHVVEGCKSLNARRTNGETFPIDVVAVDEQNDLALLRSNVGGVPATFRRGPAPLGETITVFGFPLTGTLAVSGNLTTGSISALAGLRDNPGKYQVSAPVQPGNSGGAVLDESGLVIGVVQSSLDAARSLKTTGDIPQNINFAIKSSVAQNFLEAHGVRYVEKPQAAARKASAIAEDAIRFTVLIACYK